MKWPTPVPGRTKTESDQGYMVRKVKTVQGVRFFAYEPEITREQLKRRMKVRYEIGEKVPALRRLIDAFDTPEAAKQACEEHWGYEHDHRSEN